MKLWSDHFTNAFYCFLSLVAMIVREVFGAVYDFWQAFRLLEECHVISVSLNAYGFQISDQGAFFFNSCCLLELPVIIG